MSSLLSPSLPPPCLSPSSWGEEDGVPSKQICQIQQAEEDGGSSEEIYQIQQPADLSVGDLENRLPEESLGGTTLLIVLTNLQIDWFSEWKINLKTNWKIEERIKKTEVIDGLTDWRIDRSKD